MRSKAAIAFQISSSWGRSVPKNRFKSIYIVRNQRKAFFHHSCISMPFHDARGCSFGLIFQPGCAAIPEQIIFVGGIHDGRTISPVSSGLVRARQRSCPSEKPKSSLWQSAQLMLASPERRFSKKQHLTEFHFRIVEKRHTVFQSTDWRLSSGMGGGPRASKVLPI